MPESGLAPLSLDAGDRPGDEIEQEQDIMKRLLLALLLSGCASRQDWVEAAYPGDFPTRSGAVRTSPSGLRVSGDLSIDKADFIVDTVYECLGREVPTGKLTPQEDLAALCYEDGTLLYPKRSELIVIVGPHELSCDQRQELLTVSAPDSGCRAKGREPTPECPCRWRAGYRDGSSWWPWSEPEHLHIVTPSAYMLSDTLTRFVTGCHNPWAVPRLANCARPKVPPLPSESTVTPERTMSVAEVRENGFFYEDVGADDDTERWMRGWHSAPYVVVHGELLPSFEEAVHAAALAAGLPEIRGHYGYDFAAHRFIRLSDAHEGAPDKWPSRKLDDILRTKESAN